NLKNHVNRALEQKLLDKRDAAIAVNIKFYHPAADVVGIKLLVPGGIKRVGEIDPLAIAADFHHMWSARQRLIGFTRVGRSIGNATDANGAGLPRIEWIRYVVLQKLARSPA